MAGIPCCTYKQNGKKITLLDTPGFDDASRSSAEILENIANFLSGIGDQGIYLSGIILLQPIQGVEMQGSEKKLIRLIEDVVGKDNFERVILATTQWNKLKSKKEGLSKQEKWKAEKNCWGGMVEHGAQVVKHDDNKSSARKIVGMILDIKTPPAPLQLQLELAANQFAIASTTAGIRIMEELDKSTKNLVGKLNLAREKQSETVNGHGSQLQDEVDNLQDKFKKLQDEINNLQDGIDNQQKQREKLKSAKVGKLTLSDRLLMKFF